MAKIMEAKKTSQQQGGDILASVAFPELLQEAAQSYRASRTKSVQQYTSESRERFEKFKNDFKQHVEALGSDVQELLDSAEQVRSSAQGVAALKNTSDWLESRKKGRISPSSSVDEFQESLQKLAEVYGAEKVAINLGIPLLEEAGLVSILSSGPGDIRDVIKTGKSSSVATIRRWIASEYAKWNASIVKITDATNKVVRTARRAVRDNQLPQEALKAVEGTAELLQSDIGQTMSVSELSTLLQDERRVGILTSSLRALEHVSEEIVRPANHRELKRLAKRHIASLERITKDTIVESQSLGHPLAASILRYCVMQLELKAIGDNQTPNSANTDAIDMLHTNARESLSEFRGAALENVKDALQVLVRRGLVPKTDQEFLETRLSDAILKHSIARDEYDTYEYRSLFLSEHVEDEQARFWLASQLSLDQIERRVKQMEELRSPELMKVLIENDPMILARPAADLRKLVREIDLLQKESAGMPDYGGVLDPMQRPDLYNDPEKATELRRRVKLLKEVIADVKAERKAEEAEAEAKGIGYPAEVQKIMKQLEAAGRDARLFFHVVYDGFSWGNKFHDAARRALTTDKVVRNAVRGGGKTDMLQKQDIMNCISELEREGVVIRRVIKGSNSSVFIESLSKNIGAKDLRALHEYTIKMRREK